MLEAAERYATSAEVIWLVVKTSWSGPVRKASSAPAIRFAIAPPTGSATVMSDGKSRCSLPLRTVMAVATGTRVVSARDMDSLAQDDIEETFRSMCHFIP